MRTLLDCVVCDRSRAVWQMLHFVAVVMTHYTASYPEDTSPIAYKLKLEASCGYGPP